MRKIGLDLALLALAGCKKEAPKSKVEQILDIGVQAEKDLQENAAKRDASKDLKEMVELGKQEKIIVDSAVSRINALLGGKGSRIEIPLGKGTDSIPVAFGHGSIGVPDFWHGEFKINLQVSGVGKRPLPEGILFQLSALDGQGKVLFAKEASMVDSAKIGDSLFAGGMFKGSDIRGLASVAAR